MKLSQLIIFLTEKTIRMPVKDLMRESFVQHHAMRNGQLMVLNFILLLSNYIFCRFQYYTIERLLLTVSSGIQTFHKCCICSLKLSISTKILQGLILYSDQEWQYQLRSYHSILREKGILQVMSRKGNVLWIRTNISYAE